MPAELLATVWRDDGPAPGAVQMERDTVLWHAAEAGADRLVWRFYSFMPAVVTVGKGERVEVDGVVRVRRPTGGRMLYHAGDFAYAVAGSLHHPLFAGGLVASYRRIGELWQRCLRHLGVEVAVAAGAADYRRARYCAETVNTGDLVAGGRKLLGSAQRRGRYGVMQHGSICLCPDWSGAASALGCRREQLVAKMISLEELADRPITYDEVLGGWRKILAEAEEEAA